MDDRKTTATRNADVPDVLIVGAGPAGLTMANILAREGVSFRIVDKKAGPVAESRALVVHAKTLELLDRLGLAGQAIEEGRRLGAVELLSEGKSAGTITFLDDVEDDRTPYPIALVLEQHKTERLLIEGLENAGKRIEWGTELLNLAQTPDGARATFRRPDGSEEVVEAGWVVGADGAHSPVRHLLGLGFEGSTYEQVLYVADVEMESSLESGRGFFDLTRPGFNAFFPMPGDRRFRLIGSLSPGLADRREVSLDEVRRMVSANTTLHVDVRKVRWTSVYRIHSRMTERFRAGRVFLVGDAAHIHSPAGGQGMNTGIGDAYNLAWKLAMVARGEACEELLDSYEAERMPFARSILKGSDRGFILAVTANPAAQKLKPVFVPLLFRLLSNVPPLRRRAFWLLSQLWTNYRESPAVMGPDGQVPRAGDRAPYGFFEAGPEAGKSIFETLGDLDHHLLLFEGLEPDPRLEAAREEIEGLFDRYELSVNVQRIESANQKLHERYGANASSVFLIRPDGHVAFRGAVADVVDLKVYLDRLFARRGARERALTVAHQDQTAR